MAAFPRWYKHLAQIRELLNELPQPILDRPSIEKIFGVSTRQAQNLMSKTFAGFGIGRSVVVDRQEVISKLNQIEATGVVEQARAAESRRQAMKEENMRALREREARKKVLQAEPQPLQEDPMGYSLPPSARLVAPNTIEIKFAQAEDLLSTMHSMIKNFIENSEAFEDTLRWKEE